MSQRHHLHALFRAHPWLVVLAATVLAVGLVELVGTLSSSPTHRFLLWNLFLAWVPLPLAAVAYVAHRLGFGLAAIAPFLAGWLLFFPNAPYIVTDLIHFGELNSQIPVELDLATLVAAAVAGMLVGFTSLYVVQRLITDRYGRAAGWILVLVALVLASVGVYIVAHFAGTLGRGRQPGERRRRPAHTGSEPVRLRTNIGRRRHVRGVSPGQLRACAQARRLRQQHTGH